MPERQFGPYRLVHQIATGGMAEIYLAKTKGIGGFEKFIALKMIHPNYSSDDHFVQMLVDEAKISVQLSHVNIGQVFDLGRVGDTFYITMEFVDGCDLYKILRRASEQDLPMPIDVAVHIAKEVCMGLDYAHRKRDVEGRPLAIVHRDISPQNVLVSYAAEVKVVDFGIAKASMRAKQTAVGVIKGKYYYMSPEQAWGDPLDHRTDIFSTGILLYEMLTGQMLYLEEDMQRLLDMVRKAEIPPPSTKRPDVPPELDRLVMKALAKKREQRWASAHDFGQELERFLHGYAPDFTQQKVAAFVRQAVGEAAPIPLPAVEESRADPSNPLGRVTRGMSRVDLMDRGEFAGDENSVIFRLDELKKQAPPPSSRAAPAAAPPRRSAQVETQRPGALPAAPPAPASRPASASAAPRPASASAAPRPASASAAPRPASAAPSGAPRAASASAAPPLPGSARAPSARPPAPAPPVVPPSSGAPARPLPSAPSAPTAPVRKPASPSAAPPAPARPAPPRPAPRPPPAEPPPEEATMISGPPGFGGGPILDDATGETTLDRLLDDQVTGETRAAPPARIQPITEERSDEEPTRLDVGLPTPTPKPAPKPAAGRPRAQTPTATAPVAPPATSPPPPAPAPPRRSGQGASVAPPLSPAALSPATASAGDPAGASAPAAGLGPDRGFDEDDDLLGAPTTRRKGSELPLPPARNPRPAVSAIAPPRASRRTPAAGVPTSAAAGPATKPEIPSLAAGAAGAAASTTGDGGTGAGTSPEMVFAPPTGERAPETPTPGPLPSPTPMLVPADGVPRIPLSAPSTETPLPGPLPGPDPAVSLGGAPAADPWAPIAQPYLPGGLGGDTGFTDMSVSKLRAPSTAIWWIAGAIAAIGIIAAVVAAVRSSPAAGPTTASIEVISIPGGATVKIDGVALPGVTPLSFTDGKPGKSYKLVVELAKHEPWAREEPIPAGTRQVKVIASLKPILGKLTVTSEPSGADVFLNNRPVGRTPLTLPSVDPFVETKVELRLRGHKPAVEAVTWAPPYEAAVAVKLVPSR